MLGRAVEWKNEELRWEADPRHVKRILDEMELTDCNGSSVPGVKLHEEEGDDKELKKGQTSLPVQASLFRTVQHQILRQGNSAMTWLGLSKGVCGD